MMCNIHVVTAWCQVAGVESITNGEFLLLTGQAVLDAMSDFQVLPYSLVKPL